MINGKGPLKNLAFITVSIFFLSCSGCSSLIIRDDDTVPLIATKVIARTVLGIVTLGLSEAEIAGDKRHEERWRIHQEFIQSLRSEVHRMNYDEALHTWGPPDSVARGDRVIVSVWKGGDELTLYFDSQSKLLTSWKYWNRYFGSEQGE